MNPERAFAWIVNVLTLGLLALLVGIACSCTHPPPTTGTPATDPDTYNVPFVALILGGLVAVTAWTTSLVVGPICYRRGRSAVLRTLRVPHTPRL